MTVDAARQPHVTIVSSAGQIPASAAVHPFIQLDFLQPATTHYPPHFSLPPLGFSIAIIYCISNLLGLTRVIVAFLPYLPVIGTHLYAVCAASADYLVAF